MYVDSLLMCALLILNKVAVADARTAVAHPSYSAGWASVAAIGPLTLGSAAACSTGARPGHPPSCQAVVLAVDPYLVTTQNEHPKLLM